MKRLFAMLAFIAGGLAAELRAPLQCSAIHTSAGSALTKRRKV